MSGDAHPDLGPELRQIAQALLDRLDPAVRLAAARAAAASGPGKCQQVWCPVCALAALIAGEQHPLLSVVAEHSVALLTVVRAVIDESSASTGSAPAAPPTDGADPVPPSTDGPGRYQHIPVSVDESES